MKNSVRHERKHLQILIKLLLSANIASIFLGFLYIVTGASHNKWNIFGLLLILTLLGNVAATLLESEHTYLDYLYYLLTIVAMVLIPIMNRSASEEVVNATSRSITSLILFFSLFVLGIVISNVKLQPIKKVKRMRKRPIEIRLLRMMALLIFTGLILLFGIYLTYKLLVGRSSDLVEMVLPANSLYVSIIFFTLCVFVLKMLPKTLRVLRISVMIMGLSFALIFSLPLLSTLLTISDVESAYAKAFDKEPTKIVAPTDKQYFSEAPFRLPDYFLGVASGDHQVQQNILYYEGKTGVDQGIKLYFDAYMPPEGKEDLPGKHAVLIRIHGGAWTAGDKGSLNRAQINKHFASQGYVVFDVQHGLSHADQLFDSLDVPKNKVAGFTIDDMVRHVGIFTDYLAKHHEEFGANLDSVFLSGRSSGGQLANAVALGAQSRDHNVIHPNLTIKGIISVYPAIGLSEQAGIDGNMMLTDPGLLVKKIVLLL